MSTKRGEASSYRFSARETVSILSERLSSVVGSDGISEEEMHGALMGHILETVAALVKLQIIKAKPTHFEVFRGAVNSMLERATQAPAIEPYPVKWINQEFQCHKELSTESPINISRAPSDWLPLHWCALLSGGSESAPAGAVITNGVHFSTMLEEDTSLNIVDSKYEVSPLSLSVAKAHPSMSFIDTILRLDSKALATPDRDGAVALMYAAAWNANTVLLERLHTMNPNACSSTDAYGFYPLHFACYVGTLSSVQFLLQKYPKAVRLKNRAGTLPFLASCVNSRWGGVQMAKVLLETYPQAISITDDEGNLPLHMAAQHGSIELIRYLHSLHPVAASTPNTEGLLPMHFAALRKDKDIEVVNYLTEMNSDENAAKFVPTGTKKDDCKMS
jgi:hypothetical protein